jgi:hypothetical protein
VEDSQEDIKADIIEAFELEDEEEEDEIIEEQPIHKVTVKEAMQALKTLIQHEEQADRGDGELVLQLEKQMRVLQLRKTREEKQSTLDSWFK